MCMLNMSILIVFCFQGVAIFFLLCFHLYHSIPWLEHGRGPEAEKEQRIK